MYGRYSQSRCTFYSAYLLLWLLLSLRALKSSRAARRALSLTVKVLLSETTFFCAIYVAWRPHLLREAQRFPFALTLAYALLLLRL